MKCRLAALCVLWIDRRHPAGEPASGGILSGGCDDRGAPRPTAARLPGRSKWPRILPGCSKRPACRVSCPGSLRVVERDSSGAERTGRACARSSTPNEEPGRVTWRGSRTAGWLADGGHLLRRRRAGIAAGLRSAAAPENLLANPGFERLAGRLPMVEVRRPLRSTGSLSPYDGKRSLKVVVTSPLAPISAGKSPFPSGWMSGATLGRRSSSSAT